MRAGIFLCSSRDMWSCLWFLTFTFLLHHMQLFPLALAILITLKTRHPLHSPLGFELTKWPSQSSLRFSLFFIWALWLYYSMTTHIKDHILPVNCRPPFLNFCNQRFKPKYKTSLWSLLNLIISIFISSIFPDCKDNFQTQICYLNM